MSPDRDNNAVPEAAERHWAKRRNMPYCQDGFCRTGSLNSARQRRDSRRHGVAPEEADRHDERHSRQHVRNRELFDLDHTEAGCKHQKTAGTASRSCQMLTQIIPYKAQHGGLDKGIAFVDDTRFLAG